MFIEIKGLKELRAAFRKFPLTIKKEIADAEEAVREAVLEDKGGGKPLYPKETSANRPPAPYYVRGVGTQNAGFTNAYNSEQMDQRFYVKTRITSSYVQSTIGNTASYAPFVIGEQQSRFMAAIGWTRLLVQANKRAKKVVRIYSDAVRRALRKLRIKVK